jgi:hypothetical protein
MEVHLHQNLLHPSDVRSGAFDELLSMPQIGTQRGDLRGGSEAAAKQPDAVKLLDPLTVQDIALTSRNVLDVPRIDEHDLEAALFEDLEDRNPVHAGRFHRDRLDLAGPEPVGETMKIGGEGLERAHRFSIPFRRYGNIVSFGSAVDPCGIAIDPLEQGGMLGFLPTRLTASRAIVSHRQLLHTASVVVEHPGTGVRFASLF